MGTALASPTQPYSEVVATLRAAQKSNRGAPGYARWVNRKLGRYLAAAAFKAGLTPNHVTTISAVFTFTAMILIATLRPTIGVGVLIAALLAFGFALDAADGQLARLRGGGSPAGEWLDHVVDCVKCSALHLTILISWYRFFDLSTDALLLIPLAFAMQSSIFFFTIILTEQLRRSATGVKPSSQPHTNEHAPVLRSIIVLPADYGLFCVSFVLFGFHTVFIWVYAVLAVINIGFLLGALPKWYGEMTAISKPAS
jgi:phosphatidylglycerophosphate synthase